MKTTRGFSQIKINSRVINLIPGGIVWKDINSVIIGANEEYAQIFGFKSVEDTVGKTDFDLPCGAAKNADAIIKLDKTTLLHHNSITALEVYPYQNKEIKIYLTRRKLLYDYNKDIIGTVCHGTELPLTLLKKLLVIAKSKYRSCDRIANFNFGSYQLGGSYINSGLSIRESHCLFYLLRGKTLKEIAKALKISPRTVESYLDNVKNKFCCRTKSELIAAAIERGFMYSIPVGITDDFAHESLMF